MKENQMECLKPLCHLKGCKNPRRGSIIEKEETKEREPNGMLKTFYAM
jgi:hypothetical protein